MPAARPAYVSEKRTFPLREFHLTVKVLAQPTPVRIGRLNHLREERLSRPGRFSGLGGLGRRDEGSFRLDGYADQRCGLVRKFQ